MVDESTEATQADKIIGNYRVIRTISVGGMGVVYAAARIGDSSATTFAIKLVHPDEPLTEHNRARLLREAQVAQSVQNEHLVRVLETGESDGEPYIVMEFIEGRNLEDLIKRNGQLDPLQVAELVDQMADGLLALHAVGVIHRDLTLRNIMVVENDGGPWLVKLVDFGLSKRIDHTGSSVTSAGRVLGTHAFLSPEAHWGLPLDARSDVYQLALVVTCLLIGDLTPNPTAIHPRFKYVMDAALNPLRDERTTTVRLFAKQFRDACKAAPGEEGTAYLRSLVDQSPQFLNYDLRELSESYAGEPGVHTGMPYVDLDRWRLQTNAVTEPPLTVVSTDNAFVISDGGDKVWTQVVDEGMRALEKSGHNLRRNESKIRVTNFNPVNRILSVQPATYNDQRKSNLILDFRVTGLPTLRELLHDEYGNKLPPLDDKRVANTLGIAMMVIIPMNGHLVAYCVRRAKKGVAVFADTWNCTASGAAKWPDPHYRRPLHAWLEDDMLRELDEETGIRKTDLKFFAPVMLSRELVRAGKPELFFLAGALLDEQELRDRRAEAHNLNKRTGRPQEVEEDTVLDSAARFIDLGSGREKFLAPDLSHQAVALLFEASRQYQAIDSIMMAHD